MQKIVKYAVTEVKRREEKRSKKITEIGEKGTNKEFYFNINLPQSRQVTHQNQVYSESDIKNYVKDAIKCYTSEIKFILNHVISPGLLMLHKHWIQVTRF